MKNSLFNKILVFVIFLVSFELLGRLLSKVLIFLSSNFPFLYLSTFSDLSSLGGEPISSFLLLCFYFLTLPFNELPIQGIPIDSIFLEAMLGLLLFGVPSYIISCNFFQYLDGVNKENRHLKIISYFAVFLLLLVFLTIMYIFIPGGALMILVVPIIAIKIILFSIILSFMSKVSLAVFPKNLNLFLKLVAIPILLFFIIIITIFFNL